MTHGTHIQSYLGSYVEVQDESTFGSKIVPKIMVLTKIMGSFCGWEVYLLTFRYLGLFHADERNQDCGFIRTISLLNSVLLKWS